MRKIFSTKEVINMQRYDLFEVTIRGRVVSFEFDNPWKSPGGKEYIFNTLYIHAIKQSDISPRAFDVALNEQQAEEFKRDQAKWLGKEVTLNCEARRQKAGGYRFFLINIVK
jgi:hypothetical protein